MIINSNPVKVLEMLSYYNTDFINSLLQRNPAERSLLVQAIKKAILNSIRFAKQSISLTSGKREQRRQGFASHVKVFPKENTTDELKLIQQKQYLGHFVTNLKRELNYHFNAFQWYREFRTSYYSVNPSTKRFYFTKITNLTEDQNNFFSLFSLLINVDNWQRIGVFNMGYNFPNTKENLEELNKVLNDVSESIKQELDSEEGGALGFSALNSMHVSLSEMDKSINSIRNLTNTLNTLKV